MAIGERSGDHQALTGLSTHARVRYATDPASAWQMAERALETNIGHWRNWALLTRAGSRCATATRRLLRVRDEGRESMARFPDASAIAEATELRALANDNDAAAVELLSDARRQWARFGNPVFVNRVGVLSRTGPAFAGCRGGAAARARRTADHRLARRPAAVRRRLPRARQRPTSRVSRQPRDARCIWSRCKTVRSQQALTDALALLPEAPARPRKCETEYVAVLRALASICEVAGDVDAALDWHLRLLEDDPDEKTATSGW